MADRFYRLHETTEQRIDRLERELAEHKAAVRLFKAAYEARYGADSQPEKWEPEGGKYYVYYDGKITDGNRLKTARDFGTERPTRELAEKARDAMRVHNRALAYVHEHAPDWDETNAYVVRNIAGYCETWPYYGEIGVVVGPKEVMQKLADDLNSGKVEL